MTAYFTPPMKPTYLFLTNTVGGMGGGLLYLSAKTEWLRSIGYRVAILFFQRRRVLIPQLIEFSDGYRPELEFPPSAFPHDLRLKAADSMLGSIGVHKGDRLIIESFNFRTMVWGELMAWRVNALHIAYPLYEVMPDPTPSMLNLLSFKLRQGLLFGITPRALHPSLRNGDADTPWLPAYGCSELADHAETPLWVVELPTRSFTILSIVRLDKPYVATMICEVEAFCKSRHDSHFTLILIGDAPDPGIRRRIVQRLASLPNLHLMAPGYLYPVARAVYDRSDIFLGNAGAARAARAAGMHAAVIDPSDHAVIGVLDVDTNQLVSRTTEPPRAVRTLLAEYHDRFLRHGRVERLPGSGTAMGLPCRGVDFSLHLSVMHTPVPTAYFPVDTVSENSPTERLRPLMRSAAFRSCLLKLKHLRSRAKSSLQ